MSVRREPPLQGQGWKQGHTGSSKGLTEDTEPALLLGGGIVCAVGSQTLGIRMTKELNRNTDSWASLPKEIWVGLGICLVLVIVIDS